MNYKFKYKKYAEALYSALCADPYYITMEKTIDADKSPKDSMLKYMDYSMNEALNFGELFISNEHEHGVSIWAKPINSEQEALKKQDKKSFLLDEMGATSLQGYEAITSFMSIEAEPYIDNSFWYLSIVGILPDFQGKGLGPGLIRSILEKTDSLKIPTYLETFTPRNISFYKRLGYHEIKSFAEPTVKARYWLMIRKPVSA